MSSYLFLWIVGLLVLALVVILAIGAGGRRRERGRRLDILEEALRRGDLDAELRSEVVRVLKQEHAPCPRGRQVWFGLGWLGLFAGGGMALLSDTAPQLEAGLIVMVASLAMVTLPLAIRELETRVADRGSSQSWKSPRY